MFPKRISQLSQPGLEVVIETPAATPAATPDPLLRPLPKITFDDEYDGRGAGREKKSQRHHLPVPGTTTTTTTTTTRQPPGRSSSSAAAAAAADRQAPVSAWSDSPATVDGRGSLFPREAYYRWSEWPTPDSGGSRWPSPAAAAADGQYRPVRAERRTFAFLGRRRFWLILGPLFVLLAVGLAVGLGVGLSFGRTATAEAAKATATATATVPATAPATAPTSTTTEASGREGGDGGINSGSDGDLGVAPLASASPVTAAAPTRTASVLVLAPTPIMCPEANGTVYQSYGEDPFLVLCDVDYGDGTASASSSSSSATEDSGGADTESVEECISACAGDRGCVGAGWGKAEGRFTCWMKGSLGESTEKPDWFFVIRKKGLTR